MGGTTDVPLDPIRRLSVPRVVAADWTVGAARLGLKELRRLRGELAAAEAILVGVLKTETGRDTKATLARQFGMSSSEASKAEQVAEVVVRLPEAALALADGQVTGEHLRRLTPITDADEAATLLSVARSQSPDEFAKTVDRHRIAKDGEAWRARQRKARSLRFFDADDGCVGIYGVLPRLDGERVRGAVNDACDAAWRAANPERAQEVGGHNEESRDQRMADALVGLITGGRAQFDDLGNTAGVGTANEPATTDKPASPGTARTAVIVTVQAETLESQILGVGPVAIDDVVSLIDDARTDLYAAIQSADGSIMKFGRARRLASPLQKLALALREGGRCAWTGCTAKWSRCDADHDPPWDEGGKTDLGTMRLLCKNEHHSHRHETGANITRQRDGTWSVDGEDPPEYQGGTAA